MMASLFTSPQDNVIATTVKLMELLKVKVTRSSIQKSLQEHPDYPSMLSVADVLSAWKIKSLGVQLPVERLSALPLPFIAQIKEEKGHEFAVIHAVHHGEVTYSINNSTTTLSLEDFTKIYEGRIMLTEALEGAGELQYKEKRRQEILQSLRLPFVLLLAVVLLGLVALDLFSGGSVRGIYATLFAFLSLIGIIVTGGLLWYEVDHQHPVLKKICTSGRNTNCGNVLQSKAAKLGGIISWSEIGFIYFSGGFLSLLLSGINSEVMYLLGWLNVLAAPYVLFSIYYQWRIARKWCVLCLTVQAILIAELTVTLGGGILATSWEGLSLSVWGTMLFSFLVPGLGWSVVKPLWLKAEEEKREKTSLFRLKHDPRIFNALLAKQKAISNEDMKGLGITIGHPNARFQLVKVCNPYCGPCARAHPKIEEILENNPEVSARIIFTATDEEKDIRRDPARHLMAIAGKGDMEMTKQALDDWYLAEKKIITYLPRNIP